MPSQKADVGGTSQLPCPACLSRGQTSHFQVLRRRSGGGFSHALQGRLTSPESRGERAQGPEFTCHLNTARTWPPPPLLGERYREEQHRLHTPHSRADVVRQCESDELCTACTEQSSSSLASILGQRKGDSRQCEGLPLTFGCSTESGMQGQVSRTPADLFSSQISRRSEAGPGLGSGQHKERSATFFSSTKTGKRLQDLQAAVGRQLAPPHSALHQAQNNVQGSPCP